jgi:hypothetical protein
MKQHAWRIVAQGELSGLATKLPEILVCKNCGATIHLMPLGVAESKSACSLPRKSAGSKKGKSTAKRSTHTALR